MIVAVCNDVTVGTAIEFGVCAFGFESVGIVTALNRGVFGIGTTVIIVGTVAAIHVASGTVVVDDIGTAAGVDGIFIIVIAKCSYGVGTITRFNSGVSTVQIKENSLCVFAVNDDLIAHVVD